MIYPISRSYFLKSDQCGGLWLQINQDKMERRGRGVLAFERLILRVD